MRRIIIVNYDTELPDFDSIPINTVWLKVGDNGATLEQLITVAKRMRPDVIEIRFNVFAEKGEQR